jgi:hypothetical protein
MHAQGFFPNANLPGPGEFSSPSKIYLPPKIGPSSPQNIFVFCPCPVFFSSTFDHTFFSDVFPGKHDFMGKIPANSPASCQNVAKLFRSENSCLDR